MKITKFAQSTVQIEAEGRTLLIDPGNYNFEPGRISRQDFLSVNVLIITHKHADHFDMDAVQAIHSQSRPQIFSTKELVEVMAGHGIEAQVLRAGQEVIANGFRLEGIRADHVVKGEVIDVFGVVVEEGGLRVYHASDTTYFEGQPEHIDVAFVPINNRGVAMNFEDAAKFVQEMEPRIAVPVHYDSPKDAHIDPKEWARLLEGSSVEVRVLDFGGSFTL